MVAIMERVNYWDLEEKVRLIEKDVVGFSCISFAVDLFEIVKADLEKAKLFTVINRNILNTIKVEEKLKIRKVQAKPNYIRENRKDTSTVLKEKTLYFSVIWVDGKRDKALKGNSVLFVDKARNWVV